MEVCSPCTSTLLKVLGLPRCSSQDRLSLINSLRLPMQNMGTLQVTNVKHGPLHFARMPEHATVDSLGTSAKDRLRRMLKYRYSE